MFPRIWGVYNNKLYDLTDYFYTQTVNDDESSYSFIASVIEAVFQDRSGQDITDALNSALGTLNETYREANLACLDNVFYVGQTDYRTTARCQAPNIDRSLGSFDVHHGSKCMSSSFSAVLDI